MENLALLILAGGYSERFQGKKAFFEINDQPLIKHVAEDIEKISNELAISYKTGKNKLKELFPNAKIIKDKHTEDGPIVGLLSSLPQIKSEYVAIISCDNPKINPKVLKKLHTKAKNHSAAVPKWPEGHLEPLIAVYNTTELRNAVEKTWERKEMKLSKIIEKLEDVKFVPIEEMKEIDPELKSFLNLNTLEKVEKEFGKEKNQ